MPPPISDMHAAAYEQSSALFGLYDSQDRLLHLFNAALVNALNLAGTNGAALD